MKRSSDRILTTHVGSLVRPPDVLQDILVKVAGKPDKPAGRKFALGPNSTCATELRWRPPECRTVTTGSASRR